MKKIGIFYFSGTGNTEKAATLFANSLSTLGHEASLIKIEDALHGGTSAAIDTSSFDLIGIAYPVHAFNAPKPILTFARALPDFKNSRAKNVVCANNAPHPTRYFVLRTSGEPLSLNGGSSALLRSVLRKKGYSICAEFGYVMPYNMIFRHSDEMAKLMFRTTSALVPIDATKLHEGQTRVSKIDPFRRLISFLFRVEHRAMEINGKHFRCTHSCNGCGKCARLCPVGNIQMVDGKPVFGDKCACCVRCSFHCPKNAIHIGIVNGWKINGKYPTAQTNSTTVEMDNIKISNDGKHEQYCRRSYVKYFERADAEINAFYEKNQTNERDFAVVDRPNSNQVLKKENTKENVEKSLEKVGQMQ